MAKKERVVVAMSGGVDSCVAAALLHKEGYEVIGITMQLWDHGDKDGRRFDSCCSLSDVHDARRAAHALGVPHYVVNYEKEFREGVVDYFAREYAEGRTPNPCVMCNSKLKFDHLLGRAQALGAKWVATGHYARIEHHRDESRLYRGLDESKDQSYFLFDMQRRYLRHCLFPLGRLNKREVRQIAATSGIHTAEKHESQEICFVTGNRYTDFLQEHYPEATRKTGKIVSRSGKVLGTHSGIHNYTVGQRKGLGHLNKTKPLFVAAINGVDGTVVVDEKENLATQGFVLEGANWLRDPDGLQDEKDLTVVVRYRAKAVACRVEQTTNATFYVHLQEELPWVTPGQAAVFYKKDRVIGGGFIKQDRTEFPSILSALGQVSERATSNS